MYITVDTGLKGAMVFWDFDVPIDALCFEKMGHGIDSFAVAEKLKKWQAAKIYVEQISARPNQSAKSTFTQAFVVGQLHTLSQLHCNYVEYIYPQTWTNFVKRLVSASERQKPSKILMQNIAPRFYPDFSAEFRSKRGKKLVHDGIADCLGINLYVNRDQYLTHIQEN